MRSEVFTGSDSPKGSSLPVLRRERQSKYRNLALPRNIDAPYVIGVGQVQSLAIFAAIYLGLRSPGFGNVAAFLLENVRHVVPALEMSAAEFSLRIFFVAGTLPRFLQFHFVIRKLRRSLWACGFGCRQRSL